MPVVLAALLTALARAADPADPVVVAWQVPEGCPGVQALHAGIRRSLGNLAVDRREPVQVGVVVVREAPQRFRLELRLDAGDGPSERVLTSDTCSAAVDTAAWLIAVAIDIRATDPAATTSPETTVPEPPPGPTPGLDSPRVPEPAPQPSPDPSPPPAPAPQPPQDPAGPTEPLAPPPAPRAKSPPTRDRALHLELWAGGGLGLGVLPRPAPTAALGLTLAGSRWEAELSGHYWALRRVDFGDGRGGKFAHGHVAVRGCGAWERGRVRVPLCGGLAIGGVSGEGVGALIPRTARSLWLGLLVGAGLRVALHPRVGLLLRAEAVFGLRRPGFLLEPAPGVVFRPASVGLSTFLALTIRLR
ncbi:hypothetical protein SAMN02745121_03906 [Nannocystis exedens]|uniref:Uncharacterized protein n=1 Tax=Nannocystis exedens TaxID=54 RepID=A0A1I1ZRB0_9BACT|nr:hypothetical protein [Nannocystis exedens]PCC75368.1 hypothetical protein NAEX_08478 [Nannocystis exedens]SFE33948.1 hypothetical protein SAMN02745121_03906 [Nannocystis exedens]